MEQIEWEGTKMKKPIDQILPNPHRNFDITKKCSSCGEEKPATSLFFHKKKTGKYGLVAICKECKKKIAAKYYETNANDIKKRIKKYAIGNTEKIKKYQKRYRSTNSKDISGYKVKYYQENQDKIVAYQKQYRDENLDKIKKQKKKYRVSNKKRINSHNAKYRDTNRKNINKRAKVARSKGALFDSVVAQRLSNYQEIRESPKNKNSLQVKCAYCGCWTTPSYSYVRNKIYGIERGCAGSEIYCSYNCKISCPIFNQKKYPKGFKPASSREANPMLRQMVLNRDNYTCQKCGATVKDSPLHCHHVVSARQNPMTANDISVCITLCKKCHKEIHKIPGCTYHELKCKQV